MVYSSQVILRDSPRLFRDDLTLRCRVKYEYRILNTRIRVYFVLSFTLTSYVFYR